MAETAAYQSDHVFARQPVRQWVFSLKKRLRYFLMVLRIFLCVIAPSLTA
jgi:hypothetical protein